MDLRALSRPSSSWLFALVPVALWLEHREAAATSIFFAAALALVPIAQLIVGSTEKIALHTGDAVGGLLNATLGNAPEIIISMVALRAGMHELVLGSLAGAVLGNALFATGLAFLLGGLRTKTQHYNPSNARLLTSMMLVSVISLMVPSAFYRAHHGEVDERQFTTLNLWLSGVFLVGYVLYLVFTLRTHKDDFAARATARAATHAPEGAKPPLSSAVLALVTGSVLAAFMSEALVGTAEATGEALGLSQAFIGLVVLALVGGAAEIFSAVAVAQKDKMDMAIGITMGSCVQVILFITPVLVISSLFMDGPPLHIAFGTGTIVAVLLTALLAAQITSDGRSQWFKGVQLLMVYLIIASMLYFVPAPAP